MAEETSPGLGEAEDADEPMPPSYPPAESNLGRHSIRNDAQLSGQEGLVSDPETAADDAAEEAAQVRTSWLRSVLEFAVIVVAALAISVLIKTFFMQAFFVPSGSMESTLIPGDRIAVNRMATSADEIARGDIIVFVDPGNWLDDQEDTRSTFKRTVENGLQAVGLLPANTGHHIVKRVIGIGGDTVACCSTNGNLTVNGAELDESYLDEGMAPSEETFSVTVPEGELWVMGDNRSNSKDSRYHQLYEGNGFVPVENVVGRAWAIFYPFSRLERLPDVSSVFANAQ